MTSEEGTHAGPWMIARDKGRTRAAAVSRQGNTITALAWQVGLAPGQFKHWLTHPGGSGRTLDELDPDTPLAAGQAFEIPNTILALWAGDLGWVGQRLVHWEAEAAFLQRRGFFVTMASARTSSPTEVVSLYGELAEKKALFGLTVTAHGSARRIVTTRAQAEDDEQLWALPYQRLKDACPYGLGIVVLNCCFGDSRQGLPYRTPGHWYSVTSCEPTGEALDEAGGRDLSSGVPTSIFAGEPGLLVPLIDTYYFRRRFSQGRFGSDKDGEGNRSRAVTGTSPGTP